MLGCDDNRSRTDLLDALYVGFQPDVGSFKQGIYDQGHRYEGLARPLAERSSAKTCTRWCSRATGARTASSGRWAPPWTAPRSPQEELGAQAAERELAEALPYSGEAGVAPERRRRAAQEIPRADGAAVHGGRRRGVPVHRQRLDRARGADRRAPLLVLPGPELRAEIVAGWVQAEADLATHQPVVVKEIPKGMRGESLGLPAVVVRGQVVTSDLRRGAIRPTHGLRASTPSSIPTRTLGRPTSTPSNAAKPPPRCCCCASRCCRRWPT
jgi:hypothetical protein